MAEEWAGLAILDSRAACVTINLSFEELSFVI